MIIISVWHGDLLGFGYYKQFYLFRSSWWDVYFLFSFSKGEFYIGICTSESHGLVYRVSREQLGGQSVKSFASRQNH